MASSARVIRLAGPRARRHRTVEEQPGDPFWILAVDLSGEPPSVADASQDELVDAEGSPEVDEVGGALDGVVAVEINAVGLETFTAQGGQPGDGRRRGPRTVRSWGSRRRTRDSRDVVRCVPCRARRSRRWCGCLEGRARWCRRPNRSMLGSRGRQAGEPWWSARRRVRPDGSPQPTAGWCGRRRCRSLGNLQPVTVRHVLGGDVTGRSTSWPGDTADVSEGAPPDTAGDVVPAGPVAATDASSGGRVPTAVPSDAAAPLDSATATPASRDSDTNAAIGMRVRREDMLAPKSGSRHENRR